MTDLSRLDVLALGAHPDDVELSCGGTLCMLKRQGYRTGVVDFTRGELGSRGTPEGRLEEARAAAEIMQLDARENLDLPDGQIDNTPENREKVIRAVRRYRPHIVLVPAPECRHPDHGRAAQLAVDALFYAGLRKIETVGEDGRLQETWRPHHVLHYMQAIEFTPTFVVDISPVWEQRKRAILAFRSQFFNESYEASRDEPTTFISNPDFLAWLEARARSYGYRIGAEFGEPLLYRHGPIGVDDLVAALGREKLYR